ncbi:carboxypeptidase-like regulatory domain-containing protein [Mucilaginibacter sp. UR6-1]|uniref:carboxypeptidase-like regulatory domain-containing protein n=1 Tax=Mucilaginibacter sp. UR6-1 TaxID=1435643 RepID=UPI001E5E8423|nr:carboxypeptidase-like regulatory domain-containing protein [Mucilaginibacter sp. UR6-1]MCC8407889.1 carboxypeptidase-like regulatory domain-containing protein [Mucilaginibacter sp. UR6-1]
MALKDLVGKYGQVAEAYPIEKVYLHFDKPYYAVGDTVWFKAYLTYTLNMPSPYSKIIYVDVLNGNDGMVQSLTLPVKDGTATGMFKLTKELYGQDNYHIKAYTKWMANFDADYFFSKTIPVGNAIKPVEAQVSLKREIKNQIPEITANVAFTDQNGSPYGDKKISWVVTSGDDELAKGKGNIEKNGQLNVVFANTKNTDLTNAQLKITYDGADRQEQTKSIPLSTVAGPVDVQFFPEGGNLLAGVATKIAVKAVQPNGLGIGFKATVTDNAGTAIATCESQHAGMGAFIITPQPGKSYKADVTLADGSRQSYDLPRPQMSGVNLNVNPVDTGRMLIVISADSSYLKKNQNKAFYIVGRAGQVICYAAQTTLVKASYSAFIPTNKFPTGVIQLTLLNSYGQPLSERLVFVKHNDQLALTVSGDKPSYNNRSKVRLNVSAKNNALPAEGELSLAVIDEGKVKSNENAETTILSSLLLTSELKGYIEDPNYYFRPANKNALAQLDVLMLTQGYRRFTYREVVSSKLPQLFFLPEQGMEITGTLRNNTGMPMKGGSVTLQIPSKFYTTRTITDAEGRFKFSNLVFTDSSQVIVSAKSNYNSKNLMVMVDPITYPNSGKVTSHANDVLNIDTMMTAYLQNSKKFINSSTTLQEVVIKAKAKPKLTDHSQFPSLSGLSSIDARVVTGEQLKGCPDVLSCLQSMAPGVTYDAQAQAFYVSRDYNQGKRVPMAIFAQGGPVDINYLRGLNGNDVESVEVFLRDDLGLVNRTYQTNGVLSVYTKKAPQGQKISVQELQDLLPQPSVAKLSPKGYDVAKTFYSPKYLPGNKAFGADLRSTIYWNPRVQTDKATGKTFVEFYTADSAGSYKVVVEGTDNNGHLGRAVYQFKVQ